MQWIILGIIVSYLIGSIPTAYIFGWILKGIDIRNFGSGNVGATNALRILGKGPGIMVLVLDILKGVVPVLFLGNFVMAMAKAEIAGIPDEMLRILLGLSCISGHNWTIFLRFKGGKGVATTLGVLLGLAVKVPGLKIVLGLVILTWTLMFILVRIVSLASVISSISLPIYMVLFKQPNFLILFSIILAIFIILRHRFNITRVLRGEERRLF